MANKMYIQIMDNRQIIQSMIFSRLRGQLNVYELRLLMRVVEFAQIEIQGLDISRNMGPNEHDLTGKVVEIPLMSVLSGSSHHYDRVLEAAKSMMKKLVEHYEPNGGSWKAACLVSAAESTKGEGCVRLYIQPWVWNAILDFTKGFVKFDLARALSLSSAHAVRLYFLMSNQQQPICYSFNELRKLFGLEGLYARGNDFVRKVLLPAKRELDAKSPWSCDIRPIKDGRKLETCMFYPYEQRDKYSQGVPERTIAAKYPAVWSTHALYTYMRYNLEFSPVELARNSALLVDAVNYLENPVGVIADMAYRARLREQFPGKGWFINGLKAEIDKVKPEVQAEFARKQQEAMQQALAATPAEGAPAP